MISQRAFTCMDRIRLSIPISWRIRCLPHLTLAPPALLYIITSDPQMINTPSESHFGTELRLCATIESPNVDTTTTQQDEHNTYVYEVMSSANKPTSNDC